MIGCNGVHGARVTEGKGMRDAEDGDGCRYVFLVKECFESFSELLRFLQHREMPRKRKPLDLRVTDSLLHRLPLFRDGQ